ncbi:hypothetical protein BC829DRAFT_440524 [Chytridium lagenaria]|nr:hypothetical protein BC829DRAFT_440524 [Chytridium lagenaria]
MSFRTGRRVNLQEGNWRLHLSKFFTSLVRLAVVVGVPAYLVYTEYSARETSLAMREASKNVVVIPDTRTADLEQHVGKLVHVASLNVKPEVIADYDFGVEFPKSVKVSRVPEYCQWTETYTDEEIKYRIQRVKSGVRRFVDIIIIKDGRDPLFPACSLINPLLIIILYGIPFPGYAKTAASARFGDFRVDRSVLSSAKPLRTRKHYTPAEIAYLNVHLLWCGGTNNRFGYIGDGYFFSAYKASTAERLLRLAGTWVEGSLLDFQIGDLFSACEAGDVRVSFDVVEVGEKGAGVLGRLENVKGDVGVYTTTRGYKIGMFTLDASTPVGEMLRRELISTRWYLLGARLVMIAWAFYILHTSSGLTSRRHPNGPRDTKGYIMWGLQSLGLAVGAVGALGLVLWQSAMSVVTLGLAAVAFWMGRPDGFAKVEKGVAKGRRVIEEWVKTVRVKMGKPAAATSAKPDASSKKTL